MLSERWKKKLARVFKLRFAILYPFVIWAVLFGHSTDGSMLRGIWFIVGGLAIRSWANCFAIKMEKLTTSGPYAFVRHPLYLGTFLILAGFLLLLNVNWLGILLLVCVVGGIVYKTTIQKEEAMLLGKFGQLYADYQRRVPAFYPTLMPFRGGEKWGASFERYIRSQEYKLILWMLILVIIFHVKEELFIEREGLEIKTALLIGLAFILVLADYYGGVFRRHICAKD